MKHSNKFYRRFLSADERDALDEAAEGLTVADEIEAAQVALMRLLDESSSARLVDISRVALNIAKLKETERKLGGDKGEGVSEVLQTVLSDMGLAEN